MLGIRDPYEPSIVLVLQPGDDAEALANNAEAGAAEIEETVGGCLQDGTAVVLKS